MSGHSETTRTDTALKPSARLLKEVTVYDDHSRTRMSEESLNIKTVNQAFIQRNLGGSLMKTLERLPGISTIGIGSGQSKPLIRGLGFNRVVVLDKGVKHEGQQWGADHGLEIDQFAAGEVELIKGAASFIYGSDAIGGVIDVKPSSMPRKNSFGGSVNLIAKSNNNHYGTSVNLFGRYENWFFDSRVTHQDYADYRVPADTVFIYDYAVGLYRNMLRNTAGKETGLHFHTGYIGNRLRSTFFISNIFSRSGFFANAHGLEPRNVDVKLHDRSSRDVLMPSQDVNHFKIINQTRLDLSGNRLELELGYQRNFRQEFSHYVPHGYMPSIYPPEIPVPLNLEREFDKAVYSLNLRNNLLFASHSITAGFNAEYQDNTIGGWSFLVPSFKQTTVGGFIYDKLKINEHLLLHAAVRYDYGNTRMFQYADWFKSETTKGNVVVSENLIRASNLNRNFNSLVWSAGLNYNQDRFTLKANIGKSFRMPIAKELAANGVNYHYFSYERGDPNLSPEQSYQADLSVGWNTEKWTALISPFYNYFPNYIYLNPSATYDYYYGAGNQVFQYAQSRVMRYGAEVQFKYKIHKTLYSEIFGEYLYARQLSGDKKGYTLPFSPPASALLNLTWSPAGIAIFKDTYVSADYRLTGKQNNIVPPEKKTPGYQMVNIQAGMKLKLYSQPVILSFQVQNLLNRRYLNHTSFYRIIQLPEAGRNMILSVKIPFNQK